MRLLSRELWVILRGPDGGEQNDAAVIGVAVAGAISLTGQPGPWGWTSTAIGLTLVAILVAFASRKTTILGAVAFGATFGVCFLLVIGRCWLNLAAKCYHDQGYVLRAIDNCGALETQLDGRQFVIWLVATLVAAAAKLVWGLGRKAA